MPRNGDIGLPNFLLALIFVPVVVAFYVRYKWKLAQSRKKEIRRLLILASQESAQAELEASLQYAYTCWPPALNSVNIDYNYSSYSSPAPSEGDLSRFSIPAGNKNSNVVQQQFCAVCYLPTTTRCSRCKAVRYCSGRCQIIHWRKGHKDECYPPSITIYSNTNAKKGSQENATPDSSRSGDANVGKGKDTGLVERHSEVLDSSLKSTCTIINCDVKTPEASQDRANDAIDLLTASSSPDSSSASTVSSKVSTDDCSFVSPVPVSCLESQLSIQSAMSPQMTGRVADSNQETEADVSFSGSADETSIPDSVDKTSSGHLLGKGITPNGISTNQFTGSCSGSISVSSEERITSDTSASSSEVVETIPSSYSFHKSNDKGSVVSILQSGYDNSGSPLSPLKSLSDQSPSLMPQSYSTSESGSNGYMHNKHQGKSVDVDGCTSSKKSVADEVISMSSTGKCSKSSVPRSSVIVGDDIKTKSSLMRPTSRISSPDHVSYLDKNHNASHNSREKGSSLESVSVSFGSTTSFSNITASLKLSILTVVQRFRSPKHSKSKHLGLGNSFSVKTNKVIFQHDLFVKLYHEKVDLNPFGLENCGNSCYANAVLQCLVFTPPLTSFLLQGMHSKQCKRTEWCFTCEFEKLVSQSKENKGLLSPIGILFKVHSIGSNLGYGKEEDAHEFLRYVIDTMQHCEEAPGLGSVSSIEEKTLLQLTFGGYLRSNIKCLRCHTKSVNYEKLMDLSVGIDGNIRTLEEALKQFTAPETLDDDDKYFCARCKSYVKARKRLSVYEAPNVLTVVLKRFQSGKFGKIKKAIDFPEELNLTPYMSDQGESSVLYKLYAVIEHLDVMSTSSSGHYVCYVKNKHGKWFKINDSKVKPVELERVLTKGAYMLLYARPSPHPSKLVSKQNVDLEVEPASRGQSFSLYDERLLVVGRDVDSSSESSSLLSCSDEASCSTESTRDSTSNDDYSEYIFGDPGKSGWDSPTSALEGPTRYSPSIDREQELQRRPSTSSVGKSSPTKVNYDGGIPRTGRRQWSRNESPLFLYSDLTNPCVEKW